MEDDFNLRDELLGPTPSPPLSCPLARQGLVSRLGRERAAPGGRAAGLGRGCEAAAPAQHIHPHAHPPTHLPARRTPVWPAALDTLQVLAARQRALAGIGCGLTMGPVVSSGRGQDVWRVLDRGCDALTGPTTVVS